MDNSIFHHASARQNISKLIAVMLSLVMACYALLWFYAKEQQRVNGDLFLQNIITQLNHDINDHTHIFSQHEFSVPSVITSYQVIVFEPNGNTINISNDPASTTFKLPTWTSTGSDVQTLRYANAAEFWRPLDHRYRVYIYVEFVPTLQNFHHPIYALPVLIALFFLMMFFAQLHKSYTAWSQLLNYVQNFSKITQNLY